MCVLSNIYMMIYIKEHSSRIYYMHRARLSCLHSLQHLCLCVVVIILTCRKQIPWTIILVKRDGWAHKPLPALPCYLISPCGVRVVQSLVICVVLCWSIIVLSFFSVSHSIICPSICGFWLPIWYPQTFLSSPGKLCVRQAHTPIKVIKRGIAKLPNSEQSYKGNVKTHKYINRQNQPTTGNR
jgi:hypothetical protein